MKKILIVSKCVMRGDTTGLTGKFLKVLNDIDSSLLEIYLFDIGFFEVPHNPENYQVSHYYGLPKMHIEKLIRKIPKLRSWYAEQIIVAKYRKIFKYNDFDAVVLFHIPACADELTSIAHKNNSKVVFYPGGSDILRVSGTIKKRLKKAFDKAEYVVGAVNSNTILGARDIYNVPEFKIKMKKNYLSGVRTLMQIDKSLSREEMMQNVGLDIADYNIVCGYNGYPFHRHKHIIDALASNISVLPDNYQLIFPVTYGASQEYIRELRDMCFAAGLKAVFLTSFLSIEQMAYLHLVTDLFIEIQPTDAGNAFMIEALFAGNKIITGRWLNYKQFEQFGEPYYLIDKPEDLSEMLAKIFTHQIAEAHVPQELIDMFTIPKGYRSSDFWRELFDEM